MTDEVIWGNIYVYRTVSIFNYDIKIILYWEKCSELICKKSQQYEIKSDWRAEREKNKCSFIIFFQTCKGYLILL